MCSINHNLKAIFIHIPKNGGSYIAHVLKKYYGFKNYYLQRPDHYIFCDNGDNSVKTHENKIHGTLTYYKTSLYLNKIMNMNKQKWNTYRIFAFIRNPYDRIVSGWNYVNKYNIEFKKFITFGNMTNCWDYWHTFMSQSEHLKDENNKINIHFIGRLEHLEEDLKTILHGIGIKNVYHNTENKLIKKNSSNHYNYVKYYENNDILYNVNKYIIDDINIFKYEKIENISQFYENSNSKENNINLLEHSEDTELTSFVNLKDISINLSENSEDEN
jgi:hypothetical protein